MRVTKFACGLPYGSIYDPKTLCFNLPSDYRVVAVRGGYVTDDDREIHVHWVARRGEFGWVRK